MKNNLTKKFISKMTETNFTEIEQKMAEMDKIMNANLFKNPIREINESFRKDLLEFREIFNNNLITLENSLEKNPNQLSSNNNEFSGNAQEEINNLKKIIEKKNYQLMHLKNSFDTSDKINVLFFFLKIFLLKFFIFFL